MEALKQLKGIINKVHYQGKFDKLFSGEDTTLKDGLKELTDKLKTHHESITKKVNDNISSIDNILSRAVMIPHSDAILVQAGNMALTKSAPVHKKNGYADAVIVLTFLDYVNKNTLSNASFVTYNTDDFCEKDSKGEFILHSDLQPLFTESNATFHTLLAQPLNAIDKDLVSDELLWLIEQDRNDDTEYCTECERGDGYPNRIDFYEPENIENESGIPSHDGPELPLGLNELPKSIDRTRLMFQRGRCDYCGSQFIKCSCGDIFLIDDYTSDDEHQCTGCGLTYKRTKETDRKGEIISEDWIILDDRKIKCSNCGARFLDHNFTGLCDECDALPDD